MKKSEVNRFNKLYEHHQRSLKLQGKAKKTIEAYSRAVRRVRKKGVRKKGVRKKGVKEKRGQIFI